MRTAQKSSRGIRPAQSLNHDAQALPCEWEYLVPAVTTQDDGRATGVDVHSWMSHQKQLDDRQRPSATVGSGHSRLYLAMSARLGWTPSSCWEPMWGKRECGSSAGSIVNQIGNPHDFFFLVVKPMLGFPEKR